MTVKPADDAPIYEQQMRMSPDTIPGVVCQFYARSSGKMGLDRALAGTTGTSDIIIDKEGRVPDARPEYYCLAGHRTMEKILRERMAEWTTGDRDKTNAGAVFPNAGIIIYTPEGT